MSGDGQEEKQSVLDAFMFKVLEDEKVPDDAPEGYEFTKDPELDDMQILVGTKSGVHSLAKPVKIRHAGDVGYGIFYCYCPLEGVKAFASGEMGPQIPVAAKSPEEFGSIEKIVKNFIEDDEKMSEEEKKAAFKYCVPLLVPSPLLVTPDDDETDDDIVIVDLSRRSMTSFMQMIVEGKTDILTKILADEENDNEKMMKTRLVNGLTPLMFAATFGNVEVVKLFLENKADASFVLPGDMTALMMLAIGYHENKDDAEVMDAANYKECIKILKEAGCDVTKVNKKGDSVLDMAKKFEEDFLIAEFS